MRILMFCHSLRSDWNHGNAHFLRGIASELIARGHDVEAVEPANSWSLDNLLADSGDAPLKTFSRVYPGLRTTVYDLADPRLERSLEGADVVIVHEWNEPSLVARIGAHRASHGGYSLLFHDTHHRSVTAPAEMSRFDLRHYDGVLAFGDSVAAVYHREGWAERVWTWHEAADTRVFHPLIADKEGDLIWIGNWGDGERTAELQEFLFAPAGELRLRAKIHGVRYPQQALDLLRQSGFEYGGWVPNFHVPELFAHYGLTVHIPRRPYATALPGIPTIRVFEALACGIPLISAPWDDSEHLFQPGTDFLVANTGSEMKRHMKDVLGNHDLAHSLAASGLATILERHTCSHRVTELLTICESLQGFRASEMSEGVVQ